jgi:hypothetical protein
MFDAIITNKIGKELLNYVKSNAAHFLFSILH